MAINCEITLELGDRGYGSSAAAQTTFLSSQMYLNPAEYDGATYYFEIVGYNHHATLPYTVDLMEGANLMASLILAANTPTGASDFIRMRSTSFVPSSGNHVYQLRLPQTAAGNNVIVHAARIVVVQVGATITRLQFPLASTSVSSTLDSSGAPFHNSTSTSYGQSDPVRCALFLLEKTLMATIAAGTPWSWETVGFQGLAATASIGLFDATANAQIGTVENGHTTTTASILTSDFADNLLTDGNELEVRVKSSNGAIGANACAARLYVRLTSASKAVIYRRLSTSHASLGSSFECDEARQLINLAQFSGALAYYEGTGWESVSGTVTQDLLDDGTSESSSGAGSVVSGSPLTFNGSTRIRQRSSALTLTASHRFVPKLTRTSGTLQSGPSYLIVTVGPLLAATYAGAVALIAGALAVRAFGVIPSAVTALIAGVVGGVTLSGSTVGTIAGPVVLVSVFLDTGTEYAAAAYVRHPSRLYEGRVSAFGTVERSIPIPAGLPTVGNLTITWADADHRWRKLLALRTPYRRLLEVKIGREETSELLFLTAYKGEIRAVHFEEEYISVEVADISARWFDNPIPSLINKTNFPNSAVDDAFFPIVFGQVFDDRTSPTGAIPCHLIDTVLHRYSVARSACEDVAAVYKKVAGSDLWALVNPADYTVTEALQAIDGVTYTLTVLDFAVGLDTGSPIVYGSTEVRCDVDGTNYRGIFGTMTAVTGTLQNPIDALINMLYYVLLSEPGIARYNVDSFQTVRDQFTTLGWLCDGAMTEPLTVREFLGQFLASFQLDLYQNRQAELEVRLNTAEDPDRPVFTDLEHILKGSVRQDLPDPTFNRILYQFARLYADDVWGETAVYDNTADQEELTLPFQSPKIQPETVELNFVRDPVTAAAVILSRSSYEDLSSYRFECDLSAPQVLDLVELGTLVGITHAGGIQDGGWVNEEFKVYRESLNLDDLRLTIGAVRRAVRDPAVLVTTCPLPDGTVGVEY